ncbi:MAG: protein-L-isoaspartate(D-aspartate) O-methyltransferase [Alphaproteobacteria bacterium]|nr:protein-L-isoaspartate(D-aspartate) O-methyltransferase [Alphaproteobacteria bacterium]
MTQDSRRIRLIMDLRNSGVTETAVLSAMERIPRENFVEESFLDQAWANRALPISCGQTISQPLVVGLMTQALELTDRHRVLEIGTGSGYQAAILSRLCRRLYTIERHSDLLAIAESRFTAMSLHNITTQAGDGWKGWPRQAPFDRILVTAAAPVVPQDLVAQLSEEGGIMVLPVGDASSPDQMVVRVTKTGAQLNSEQLFPVRFVPLVEGAADDGGT